MKTLKLPTTRVLALLLFAACLLWGAVDLKMAPFGILGALCCLGFMAWHEKNFSAMEVDPVKREIGEMKEFLLKYTNEIRGIKDELSRISLVVGFSPPDKKEF